jgi:hypothetical protein
MASIVSSSSSVFFKILNENKLTVFFSSLAEERERIDNTRSKKPPERRR